MTSRLATAMCLTALALPPGAVSAQAGPDAGTGGLWWEEDLSAFGGIDLRAPIATHTDTQPLDIAWVGGIGAGAPTDSDRVALSLPISISAGRSWSSGSVWLAPYVSLGVAFDLYVGTDAPEDEFEWSPTADLGLDLALDSVDASSFESAPHSARGTPSPSASTWGDAPRTPATRPEPRRTGSLWASGL